jgi:hypothetical protein
LFFEKNAIFRQKLAKISWICDQSIDPCSQSYDKWFYSCIHIMPALYVVGWSALPSRILFCF